MSLKYPKTEKLKSRTTIDLMFRSGKSVSKYPLRLVYFPLSESDAAPIQMGVSVSKRYFKKAVDRNYYKRILRECYRLHQEILKKEVAQKHAFMLLYQTKDRLEYAQVEEKTKELFLKFVTQQNL